VGGVVALAAGDTLPRAWVEAREPLDLGGGRLK
jgi:hypothetical protein